MTAEPLDFELPPPPTRDELLDKADRARRRAHGEPDPDPMALSDPPLLVCPTCGCDVSGCAESRGGDGLRRWTQPIKEDWPNGYAHPRLAGGLVHIEGGRRCLSDAGDQQ